MAKTGMAASSADKCGYSTTKPSMCHDLVSIIKPAIQWCGGLQIWQGEESCWADLDLLCESFHHVVIEHKGTTKDFNFVEIVTQLRSSVSLVDKDNTFDVRCMLHEVKHQLNKCSAVKVMFTRSTESEILMAMLLNQILDFTTPAAKRQIEDKVPKAKFEKSRFRLKDLNGLLSSLKKLDVEFEDL